MRVVDVRDAAGSAGEHAHGLTCSAMIVRAAALGAASGQRRMMRRASQLPSAWMSCTAITTTTSADHVTTSSNWR